MVGLFELSPEQKQILDTVKEFVDREIVPIAKEYEHDDRYPFELVDKMKELGLFGALVPEEYGGLGLSCQMYVRVFEELSRGWMSVAGILGTHSIMVYMIREFGNDEQKQRYLPALARGEKRGALALTEPNAGSDVQNLQTTAVRDGDSYVVNGSKMFITNARHGTSMALLAKTDRNARPAHRGISLFIVDKGAPGLTIMRDLQKLGYKGLDTCELVFQDFRVPAANLVGREGEGFRYVMSGLEVGRLNVAGRAIGVARAAFEDAIRYAQQRVTFGQPIAEHQAIQMMLADMATKIEAARLLALQAAAKKDRGERADLEAGMAKLFASEACGQIALDAMRIHGGYGYTKEFNVERYYRDAPLMIIGEGTNEIQKLVIARNLLKRYAI
ncbi:MAG: acyl-CoA dehydrogenase family protein [Clostridia bacterium]|nr:acyl-CoA dehydrogenase family protein [Clostridia bacterium]